MMNSEIRMKNGVVHTMAGTIIDYLKEYGDCSFCTRPMNDVDSLVLCQLSYLKFDGMVPDVRENKGAVTFHDLREHPDFDGLFADVRFEKNNRAMVEAALAGRRFGSLKLNCYINLVRKEWETQFCAVTFLLEDGTIYIAFRGTDETIVGWKEDFNMAFLSPVPAQAYSVKYLNMVMGRIHRPFYVGGHSKGGNLAVYSAMKCLPQVQNRILKVYSMDGPGFRPEVLAQGAYEKIADKVVKILPHSSMVGMLFERDIHYQVVESRSFGLAQHDPYSWLVDQGEFVKVDDIYERRRRMNDTLNEWILSLDEEKLRTFVDTLYQVVSASEAEDLIAFTSHWRKSMNGVIGALKEVDHETAKMLREIVKSLFEIAGSHVREQLTTHSAQGKGHEKHKPRRTKGPESVSRTK